jgi:putative transposase
MPWEETCIMDERMAFIVDWQRNEMGLAALCRFYGVSRKTGYKWIERFESEGIDGLKDRSRAPLHHPNAVSEAAEAAIVAVRVEHPSWGPKKIKAWLKSHRPRRIWPAQSVIATILDRHGLVQRREIRRRVPLSSTPLSACANANDVWGIDFKGWFRTGDGQRCDPLSLSDLASRYVLRLQAIERTDGEHVWPIIDAAFREFGLPLVMRSDSGPPFASVAAGGLSPIAVRLIKAGVLPERIEPGKPQQNGRHERLHLTVQQETANPPAATLRGQQRRFDKFRRVFNEERPHEALGQVPPIQVYNPPVTRPYHGKLREPEYPSDDEVRRVRPNGEIKWRNQPIFISQVLAGEPVGLHEIDEDGRWEICYGPIELGTIDAVGKFCARKAGTRPRLAGEAQPQG